MLPDWGSYKTAETEETENIPSARKRAELDERKRNTATNNINFFNNINHLPIKTYAGYRQEIHI